MVISFWVNIEYRCELIKFIQSATLSNTFCNHLSLAIQPLLKTDYGYSIKNYTNVLHGL